jgi:hypothetical protein
LCGGVDGKLGVVLYGSPGIFEERNGKSGVELMNGSPTFASRTSV